MNQYSQAIKNGQKTLSSHIESVSLLDAMNELELALSNIGIVMRVNCRSNEQLSERTVECSVNRGTVIIVKFTCNNDYDFPIKLTEPYIRHIETPAEFSRVLCDILQSKNISLAIQQKLSTKKSTINDLSLSAKLRLYQIVKHQLAQVYKRKLMKYQHKVNMCRPMASLSTISIKQLVAYCVNTKPYKSKLMAAILDYKNIETELIHEHKVSIQLLRKLKSGSTLNNTEVKIVTDIIDALSISLSESNMTVQSLWKLH